MTSRYSGFLVEVDAHRQRCGEAPLAASFSQRSPDNGSLWVWWGIFALAVASLPLSSSWPPISSRRLSASVSTRETKNEATDAPFFGRAPLSIPRPDPGVEL